MFMSTQRDSELSSLELSYMVPHPFLVSLHLYFEVVFVQHMMIRALYLKAISTCWRITAKAIERTLRRYANTLQFLK